ncbi:MAG: MBL fold metallo-hydrolase [Rhizobiaceae bacterium]
MSDALKRPKIYQFRIGDCIVTNILDGYLHRNDLHPFVATNAQAGEIEALAAEYRIPFPAMEHNFVVTLIQTPEKLIVIDPGFGGAAPTPSTGWFNGLLAEAGYAIEDVDIVLISHCHPDHIGNVASDGVPTFPNAEIVIGSAEFDYWKRAQGISEMRQPTLALFGKVLLPLEDQLRMIEPGDEIAPGLTAIDAFGHSAGHLVFRLTGGEGSGLMLLNDTVPHYVASFANPDWHFFMDDDPQKAAIARRRILNMAADEAVPVIGFHIPFPALGYVERRGEDGFEFRPATYQFNLG